MHFWVFSAILADLGCFVVILCRFGQTWVNFSYFGYFGLWLFGSLGHFGAIMDQFVQNLAMFGRLDQYGFVLGLFRHISVILG